MLRTCARLSFAILLGGCSSASLRGAGPAYPSPIGHPANRQTAMPPTRNHPSNIGHGSAYDPHGTGSKGAPGRPYETGGAAWLYPYGHPYGHGHPYGSSMGVPPPPVSDQPKPPAEMAPSPAPEKPIGPMPGAPVLPKPPVTTDKLGPPKK